MKWFTLFLALWALGWCWYNGRLNERTQEDTDEHNDMLKKLKDELKDKGLIDDTQ